MFTLLTRYASVGVVNTLIHWAVFASMCMAGLQQSLSNFAAFCVAVTFSFLANAFFTFKKKATGGKYIIYVIVMGVMSYSTGYFSDHFSLPPVVTIIIFSPASVAVGFLYFNFVAFKEGK
ncbi:translocase [Erwinia typographi]|uniref:Bactoprenol-linked glucose translocase n=1 Tax=Erwinia typographi TaxID=371042 RepID=A0A0A3YMN6_9GAMM|nr:GtrA family protein [Erwinia typographi]KGT88042.1 translocase [Erwinia typographi]